jgi:hypothetical protein
MSLAQTQDVACTKCKFYDDHAGKSHAMRGCAGSTRL